VSALPDIAVYGLGLAGQALVANLQRASCSVVTLHTRSPARAAAASTILGRPVAHGAVPVTTAALVFVAVRDGAIAEVADALVAGGCLPAGCTLVHLSGALPAQALARAARPDLIAGAWHPLRALRGAASELRGCFCALDGAPPALALLERLCLRLGCTWAHVDAARRPLYHAAAALAGNDVVALLDGALRALRQAGLDDVQARAAAVDLARSALDNLQDRPPAQALTGALVRGDDAVIASHLQALGGLDPDLVALHRAACRALLGLASARGLDRVALARLRRVLDGGDGE
jgi:predicted short-subunit dehydrogenase-like oxidoreductase (DUF2520 family)